MTASSLKKVATFPISKHVSLVVAKGSVVDFSSPASKGAIVNAANEGCLGGGGVDGAISTAGGHTLASDRRELPQTRTGVRCPTGSAVVTGPGEYGRLHVPYVIHAVGPNYHQFQGFAKPDELLRSAYQTSLDCCQSEGITNVAFALLSAGIFRGNRDAETVLRIGVSSIRDWINEKVESEDSGVPKSITLCGFSSKETALLLDVCKKELPHDRSRPRFQLFGSRNFFSGR